jgi:hypothetical protein
MYKVGDKVLVEVEIVEVDLEDSYLPYLVKFDDDTYWMNAELIHSPSPSIDEKLDLEYKQLAEVTPELKYKIGDKVQHKFKPEWGIGIIKDIDEWNYTYDYCDDTYYPVDDQYAPYGVEYSTYKDNANAVPKENGGWYTKEENLILIGEAKEN